MKKIHIIAILVIVASVTIFISASKDVSSYATFNVAIETGQRVKIVGQLDRTKDVTYKPEVDANLTSFTMIDDNGDHKEVHLMLPKPQDFELSEQIVITGEMEGEFFVANEILMKCPSKYKTEEIYLKSDS